MMPPRLRAWLARSIGLQTDTLGEATLEAIVQDHRRNLAGPSLPSYSERVLGDPLAQEQLIQMLLVTESWFDRDPALFCALEELLQERRLKAPLQVLCAPCAGGEECYSLAARFHAAGMGPDQVSIVGLDLSRAALSTAGRGLYRRSAWRSAQDLPWWLLPRDEGLQVDRQLMAYVRFERRNLALPQALAGFAPFDLILSRNFTIYLTPAARLQWLETLTSVCTPDAIVCSGPSEPFAIWSSAFAQDASLPPVMLVRSTKQPPSAMLAEGLQAAPDQTPPARWRTPARTAPVLAVQTEQPVVVTAPMAQSDPLQSERLRIRQLADSGASAAALASLEIMLAGPGADAEDFTLQAQLLLAQGQRSAAEEALTRALYLDPTAIEALTLRAAMHAAQGDHVTAQRLRKRLSRLDHPRRSNHGSKTA
jgi:chemotaxis methyl-accepting protein methylase